MTPAEYEYQQELVERELDRLIEANPDKAQQARERPALTGWFVGQVMKNLKGKGSPPQWVQQIAREKLAA